MPPFSLAVRAQYLCTVPTRRHNLIYVTYATIVSLSLSHTGFLPFASHSLRQRLTSEWSRSVICCVFIYKKDLK
ncbi:hypothetical protein HW555_011104 [Spodoptera exigua]|uniref:Uncharacterized protein n=1 Tax=Spodoptera exigua TaxID=7107 RepID=A0A835L4Y6_SPOEX|nr:hypothetical protein HW555_011104 [Spodoptera exigua]